MKNRMLNRLGVNIHVVNKDSEQRAIDEGRAFGEIYESELKDLVDKVEERVSIFGNPLRDYRFKGFYVEEVNYANVEKIRNILDSYGINTRCSELAPQGVEPIYAD